MQHTRAAGTAVYLVCSAFLATAACSGEVSLHGHGDGGANGADASNPGHIDGGPGPNADGGTVPPGTGDGPAVGRGDDFFGTRERFNRYYTDATWTPTKTVFVSPAGGGNGASAAAPTTLATAVGQLAPGTMVRLAAGTYDACVALDDSHSGTYDAPVVFVGERSGAALGVQMNCCDTGRRACFNLEATNYVAIDSIEMIGGRYGVRAVGADFAANAHQVGTAILRSAGHDQSADPFFSGQSDWFVIEGVVGSNAGADDGHGIYLSNGSDWLIVRDNELFGNRSADFQINADPFFGCEEAGVANDSAECDAVAGTSATGGRGASDFALVERNFFHDGLAQGANFTSVRNSLVRNNVFAFYARHNVSFWQESANPKLGSRDNRILHNLFVTTNGQHAVQFVMNSTANTFAQNVVLGVTLGAGGVTVNPGALLMEADATVGANVYSRNVYVGGTFDGHTVGADELRETTLQPGWFAGFPTSLTHVFTGFAPTASAPWATAGQRLADAPADMTGKARGATTALGPLEP
jgi:hypothetical protein